MAEEYRVKGIGLEDLIEDFGTTLYSDRPMINVSTLTGGTYKIRGSSDIYARRYDSKFNAAPNGNLSFTSENFNKNSVNVFTGDTVLKKGCGPLGKRSILASSFSNTFTGNLYVYYINTTGKRNSGKVYVGSSVPTSTSLGSTVQDVFFISLTMPGGNGGIGKAQSWPAQGGFGGGGGGGGATVIMKAVPPIETVVSSWLCLLRVSINGSGQTYANISDTNGASLGIAYSGSAGTDATNAWTDAKAGTGGAGGTTLRVSLSGAAYLTYALFADSTGNTPIIGIAGAAGRDGNGALSTEGDLFTVPHWQPNSTSPRTSYSSSQTYMVNNPSPVLQNVRIKSISELSNVTVPGGAGGNSFWGVGGNNIAYSNAGYFYTRAAAKVWPVGDGYFGGGGFGGAGIGGGNASVSDDNGQRGADGVLEIRV